MHAQPTASHYVNGRYIDDERGACGRAHSGVGVGLQEAHTLCGQLIDVRRVEIGTPVAGHVGIAQIVGEDEDNVGRLRLRFCRERIHTRGQRSHSQRRSAKHGTTGDVLRRTAAGLELTGHDCRWLLLRDSSRYCIVSWHA